MRTHIVKMADEKVISGSEILQTKGIGSCVAVCLRDDKGVSGMAHVVLPPKEGSKSDKRADVLIEKLISDMDSMHADLDTVEAKMFGGASIFEFSREIGSKNVRSIRDVLQDKDIPVVADETGGDQGRSVKFYCDTGNVEVTKPFDDKRLY